jgi:hypothetical protein
MTGAYISMDAGNSWRMFNLRGVVRFFVADPVNSNIIYAATDGLYRSVNKGETWELLYPQPSDVKKVLIAGDHADEQLVLKDGSHRSVEALAVDPADSKCLFAAISKDNKASLYKSEDGGKLWKSIREVPAISKLYIDPDSPRNDRTVYLVGTHTISVLEGGHFKEQDGPEGVKRFLDIQAGFPDKGAKPVFYAVSGMNWRGGDTGVTGLFTSVDGGAHWQSLPIDFLSNAAKGTANLELRAVGTSFRHPKIAYLSFRDHTSDLPPGERNMGVAKTEDMGKTWQTVWRDTEVKAAANMQDPWINERLGPGWSENRSLLASRQ